MQLNVEREVPDLYVDGVPDLAVMDAAFCRAFAVAPPGLFDGADGGRDWLLAMERQAVGLCHRLDRSAFATKLDLFLPTPLDILTQLRTFAALLDCQLALDLGRDTADDLALLIPPDGRLVMGLLEVVGPGRAEDAPEVAFRSASVGG
ncbi:hypothetical protein DFO45_3738 [Azorhizobium sp. AG788]|uniref:hypothetical protein n=1 Tax=Azorhizobium sp. AG788 TaxID=2183897 RepID=UPI00105EC558|nr:hypothetical protein [Azorhizobium sp. AG788]TDT91184.1 hypothetical protein DFO45_3738 [Azorhizobium sp. AG788]